MTVNMITLPELEFGTKRAQLTMNIPKQRFCYGAICQTIKGLAILRCPHGSEVVLLMAVIRKCETPVTTNILQENGHAILMIILIIHYHKMAEIMQYADQTRLKIYRRE